MKATFNPAQPAVTETRVLVEAKPATVTLEMSVEDAGIVKALLGATGGSKGLAAYDALSQLARAGSIPDMHLPGVSCIDLDGMRPLDRL